MDRVAALMGEAMRLGLLLYIQTSLLDMRHHPGYCYVHQVPVGDVAEAVKHYSENTFIVGGGRWFAGVARELVGRAKHTGSKNFYIATDGLGGPWDGVRGLVDQIGSSRILFSSRTPILYSEASKLMIEHSPISEEEKEAILGSNAAQLLGLSG
jgi:predicted TIM-barrel fold metal-dependent hydrolase